MVRIIFNFNARLIKIPMAIFTEPEKDNSIILKNI